MNSKWLILLLVALVILLALYVASLGVSVRGERRSAAASRPTSAPSEGGALNAPWVQTLKQRLTGRLKGTDLSLEERDPGCRLVDERLEIPVDAECLWSIAPGSRTRALRPRLVQGDAVTLILTQEGYLEIEQELPGEDEEHPSLDVYRSEKSAKLAVTDCEVDETEAPQLCLVSLTP